jgi:nucleoside-diphosphate-sugar epimerase
MRVFLTGATGFIGSAIVRELLAAGHKVLGLARSDAAADTLARLGVGAHKGELEAAVLAAAGRGVRASVVRLPPTVHGTGDHGFVPMLIDIARRTGISAFVGDGANRWPAVHRLDAARLFRLALEEAAPGARLHGVAEEGVPMRSIAQAIGMGLGVSVRGLAEDEARTHFEWFAGFVALDNPTSSALTRNAFGWRPQEPELLIDMRDGGYFSLESSEDRHEYTETR